MLLHKLEHPPYSLLPAPHGRVEGQRSNGLIGQHPRRRLVHLPRHSAQEPHSWHINRRSTAKVRPQMRTGCLRVLCHVGQRACGETSWPQKCHSHGSQRRGTSTRGMGGWDGVVVISPRSCQHRSAASTYKRVLTCPSTSTNTTPRPPGPLHPSLSPSLFLFLFPLPCLASRLSSATLPRASFGVLSSIGR